MKIEHIAIWVSDLETMQNFYETYFVAISGALYENPKKNFSSYFMTFVPDPDGNRIEITA